MTKDLWNTAQERLEREFGRDPTDDEVAIAYADELDRLSDAADALLDAARDAELIA